MSNKKINTSPIFPPINVRGLDWAATFEGYEPGCPIGHGATEQEAIADLIEQTETTDETTFGELYLGEFFKSKDHKFRKLAFAHAKCIDAPPFSSYYEFKFDAPVTRTGVTNDE